MKSIVFINWHNRKNVLNGPTNVFESLVSEIKSEDNITVISPEKGYKDFSSLIAKLKEELASKEEKSIVINSDGLKLPLNVLMLSKIYRKHSYYLIYHGLRKEEDKIIGVNNKKYYFLEGLILKNFQNVITVSNITKNLIKETYNRKKNTYVVYNGVSVRENTIEPEVLSIGKEFRLMASGGLKEIKGIDAMIKMVTFVNRNSNDFKLKLNIYGDYDSEEYRNKILALIEDRDDIEYKGTINKEKLYEEYKSSHFTLNMSKLDSFNLSVIEGMLYGAPPILNKRVGAYEILDLPEEGFVINEDNLGDVNKFFDEIYKNHEKYSIMVKKCYLKAAKFTWRSTLNKYIDLL
jgi:Glycosyltransferase